jgi:L-threonylcarbamoyladenylate synthase
MNRECQFITEAAAAITGGKLVILPTNRWYMICCDAGNPSACHAIFEAKRRPLNKALLLTVPSNCEMHQFFSLTPDAKILIKEFWPGDLALLLKWTTPTLGQRYPAVGPEIALVNQAMGLLGQLANQASCFIASTSVNFSGQQAGDGPAISHSQVAQFLCESGVGVSAIFDGGICPLFTHTTIVDCSKPDGPTEIIRDGAVHRFAIAIALNNRKYWPADISSRHNATHQ